MTVEQVLQHAESVVQSAGSAAEHHHSLRWPREHHFQCVRLLSLLAKDDATRVLLDTSLLLLSSYDQLGWPKPVAPRLPEWMTASVLADKSHPRRAEALAQVKAIGDEAQQLVAHGVAANARYVAWRAEIDAERMCDELWGRYCNDAAQKIAAGLGHKLEG